MDEQIGKIIKFLNTLNPEQRLNIIEKLPEEERYKIELILKIEKALPKNQGSTN